jgi:transposase
MPGRVFASPADFNTQFSDWLTIANTRTVRTIRARPVDLLDADRAAMLPLPPVAPVVGWVNRVRLGRDYYVRLDSNDYSVDPAVIGRFVDDTADLSRVEVRHEGRLVAANDRVWARGMTITDPAHVATAKVLREQFQRPRPTSSAADPHEELARDLTRDLADYDRAFGLIDGALTSAPTSAPTSADDGEVA